MAFVLLGVVAILADGCGENTCTILGKGNASRVIPRLYGWVYKTLGLSPLAVEHNILVMTVGS